MRYLLCEILNLICICHSAQRSISTWFRQLITSAIEHFLKFISLVEINHCISDLIQMDTALLCFRYELHLGVHSDLQSCVKQLYLGLVMVHCKDFSNLDTAVMTCDSITPDLNPYWASDLFFQPLLLHVSWLPDRHLNLLRQFTIKLKNSLYQTSPRFYLLLGQWMASLST